MNPFAHPLQYRVPQRDVDDPEVEEARVGSRRTIATSPDRLLPGESAVAVTCPVCSAPPGVKCARGRHSLDGLTHDERITAAAAWHTLNAAAKRAARAGGARSKAVPEVGGHGIVVRTWRDERHWLAIAEAVPPALVRSATARATNDTLTAVERVRNEYLSHRWPVETASAETERGAVLEAMRRLLVRGLDAVPASKDAAPLCADAPPEPLCSRCLRSRSRHGPIGGDAECPDGFVPRAEDG